MILYLNLKEKKEKKHTQNWPCWQKVKWVGVVFERMKTDTLPQFLPTRSVFAFLFCVLFKTLLTAQCFFCAMFMVIKKKGEEKEEKRQLRLTASK